MPTYQTRNPLAVHSPLRSMPLLRPVEQVLGWSARSNAEWDLTTSTRNLANLEARLLGNYESLGHANRVPGPMRRLWQSQAFSRINVTRAQIRAARKALSAAEAAMLVLAPGVAAA